MSTTAQDPAGPELFSDNFSTDTQVSPTEWDYVHYSAINNPSYFGDTQTRQNLPPTSDGAAHLTVDTYNPTGPGNSFLGTDIYTLQTFEPGSTGVVFTVVAKLDQTEGGLVGGIFPYALLPPSTTYHNEIDTELVSNDLTNLSLNDYAEQPLGSGNPQTVSLPAGDSLTQWNTYQMEWLPGEIEWFIDGTLVGSTNSNVPSGPMPLYLDFWVPSNSWEYAYNSGLQSVSTAALDTTYGFDVSSVQVTAAAQPDTELTNRNDFYGTGASDILWQSTGGEVALWSEQNSVTTSASGLGGLTNGWNVAGTGDFYGTGVDDLLFENTNEDVAQWQIQNGYAVAETTVGVSASGWSIVGTGDFYGAGTDDVLFRNADGEIDQWEVQNGIAVAQTEVGTAPGNWTIGAIGNLSGSGNTDSILFMNSDGAVEDWNVMNGHAVAANMLGQASSYWSIVGIGDFTGNGQNDILFRGQSGEIQMWLMQNGQVTGTESIGGPTPLDWQIVGIGDYASNGTSDILFRNANDGALSEWVMNSGQVSNEVSFGTVPSNWQIAPPHSGITLPS